MHCPAWPNILLPALLCAIPACCQQVRLAACSERSVQGTNVTVPVGIAFAQQPIAALQFDIHFEGFTPVVAAAPGDSPRSAGKTVSTYTVGPGVTRVLIAGFNRNVLNDGVLVDLQLTLPAEMAPGQYGISFSDVACSTPDGDAAPAASENGSITVQAGSDSPPALARSGVLNDASLLSGPIAPGESITLAGSNIGCSPEPCTTTVLIAGIPAEPFFTSGDQLKVIVPPELSGPVANLEVHDGMGAIADLCVPVALAAPGLFTMDFSGGGPAVAVNEDGTMNAADNPAAKGSAVTLFLTGAGSGSLPFSVELGGVSGTVSAAAPVPDLVGVFEVTAIVPSESITGDSVPVFVTVGTARTQPGVSIAVR